MTRPDEPRDWDAIEADALAAEDARDEDAVNARRDRMAARILTAIDLNPNGDTA